MSRLLQTPSQTVGPYFGYALPFDGGPRLVPATDPAAVRLGGVVLDGDGRPVPDAMLELWQPDQQGVLPQAAGSRARDTGRFTGFGRVGTDPDGRYEFVTVRPGGPGWALVTVFARGLLHHLFTRAYFVSAGAPDPADGLLDSLPEARRATLLAREETPGEYRFDVRLQGEGETVFLDYRATT